jgi:hypothetical protein
MYTWSISKVREEEKEEREREEEAWLCRSWNLSVIRREGNGKVVKEQITSQPISCYVATDTLFHVHSLRLYLCLWFCIVNLKKEIKETGREIRKGNPPPPLPTRQEQPTLNFLIAAPCFASWEGSVSLKLFPVATSCPGSVAFPFGLVKRERPKNIHMCQMLLVSILPTLALLDVGRGS